MLIEARMEILKIQQEFFLTSSQNNNFTSNFFNWFKIVTNLSLSLSFSLQ